MASRSNISLVLGVTLACAVPTACAKVTVLDSWSPSGDGGASNGDVHASGGGNLASAGRDGTAVATSAGSGGVSSTAQPNGGTSAVGGTLSSTVAGVAGSGNGVNQASGGTRPATGGTTSVAIPYKNDFETTSALSGWLRVDNAKPATTQWAIVTDSTNSANHALQVGALSDDTFEVGGNAQWTDQSLEVKVSPTSTSGYLYVAVRYSGVNSYYFLQLQAGSKPKIRARITTAGSTSTTDVCAGTVAAGSVGSWSTVLLIAKGETLSASIDGVAVCSGTSTGIPSGGIALGTDGVQAFFDDVSVTLPP